MSTLKSINLTILNLTSIIIISFFYSFVAKAESFETINDGHWNNPTIWNTATTPGSVITNKDNVSINHVIHTEGVKITNGGGLIINKGGILNINTIDLVNSKGSVTVADGAVLYVETINGQPVNSENLPAGFTKTGTGQINPGYNPLPVNLVYFKGTTTQNATILEFATSEEVNNDYIAVERSADGVNFSTISIQNGKNVNGLSIYTFTDHNPLAGISYYRLRQVDYDGTTTYSKVIQITNNVLEMQVAEQIMFTTPSTGTIQVLNASGRAVFETTIAHAQSINLPVLASGVYIIRAAVNNQLITKKIML